MCWNQQFSLAENCSYERGHSTQWTVSSVHLIHIVFFPVCWPSCGQGYAPTPSTISIFSFYQRRGVQLFLRYFCTHFTLRADMHIYIRITGYMSLTALQLRGPIDGHKFLNNRNYNYWPPAREMRWASGKRQQRGKLWRMHNESNPY